MGAVEGEGEEGGRRRREEGVVERGGVGRGEKGEVVEVERGTSVVRDDVREGCVDEEGREIFDEKVSTQQTPSEQGRRTYLEGMGGSASARHATGRGDGYHRS